jgi:hypothetical protein
MHPIPKSIRSANVDLYFTVTGDVAKQIDYTSQGHITPERHIAEDYVMLHSAASAPNGMCVVNDDTLLTFYHSGLLGAVRLDARASCSIHSTDCVFSLFCRRKCFRAGSIREC